MSATVLVINSGSSSVKYQLVDPSTGEALATGLIEQIGEELGHVRHKAGGETYDEHLVVPDHTAGMTEMTRMFETNGPALHDAGIVAVGHRVVQGGKYFDGPALVTEEVLDLIERLAPLAPLHNPAHLVGLRSARTAFPDVPHVVVFDTAFFQSLPDAAATYALKRDVAERYEIRRYGAHGTSHQFVSSAVAQSLGRSDLKQVVLHLGNGASASAVVGGQAVDTSMGLTPLEGLVMGTRTGDIDPAVVFHLKRNACMDVDTIDTLFNKQSGLKGLCGDNDMRGVRSRADGGGADARLALDVYAHRLRKYVGSYAAVMDGIDVLTFTAGIGENDADIRREVCAGLGFLGLELDEAKNAERPGDSRVISTADSKVTVMVVPTNEELAIARQAMTLI